MFNIEEVNKHETEMLKNIQLTYEKLEYMKNKYITPQKEYIEKIRLMDLHRMDFMNY